MRKPIEIDITKADPELLALANNNVEEYISFIKRVEKGLVNLNSTPEGRKSLRNARVQTR